MSAPTIHESPHVAQPENRVDMLHMRPVQGEIFILTGPEQANTLYTPHDIGLQPEEWRGYDKVTVVGELAAPIFAGYDSQLGHAAVLRAERGDVVHYALQGLRVNEYGQMAAVPGGRAFIDPHGKIALGHGADVMARPDDYTLVPAARLWGSGTYFQNSVDMLLTPGNNRLQFYNAVDSTAWLGATLRTVPTYVSRATLKAHELAGLQGLLDEAGHFGGYRQVTRHTTLGGNNPPAVDLRSWLGSREAIVVDSSEYPEVYDELRSSFLRKVAEARAMHPNGSITEVEVLGAIYDTVGESMEYDFRYVNAAARVASRSDRRRMVNLAQYLKNGRGVCHQDGLAEAWLGGEANSLGLLEGETVVEGKYPVPAAAGRLGHAYARYENRRTGAVYIMDNTPPEPYFGPLEGTLAHSYNYFHPGEREKYLERRPARLA